MVVKVSGVRCGQHREDIQKHKVKLLLEKRLLEE